MLKRAAALLLTAALAAPAAAQGLRTGAVSGIVTAEGAQPLAGVTVTVASPALQGTRKTVTDANGAYILKGLPPGDYTVTLAHGALPSIEEKIVVAMGQTAQVDARIGVATRKEDVEVT